MKNILLTFLYIGKIYVKRRKKKNIEKKLRIEDFFFSCPLVKNCCVIS